MRPSDCRGNLHGGKIATEFCGLRGRDGSANLSAAEATATRTGFASSAFVTFGPSGNVLSSTSGVVPEPSALISSALGVIGLLARRRRSN